MKKLTLPLLFLITVSSFSQINFEKGTLAEVFAKAKEQKKLVMVDVMTDWCKWCIELDNKVYSRKDVSDFANANQINYKIDAEKGEGVDFAKKYKIAGYPSILFLDGEGNEVDRIYGYVPPKDFLETMTDYNKGINTYSYLKSLLEKEPNNVEALLKMSDKHSMMSENEDAKKCLNKILELDPQNAKGKTDDAKYRLATFEEKDKKITALESFIKDNPNSDQLKDAYISLAEAYLYEAKDIDKSELAYADAFKLFPNDDALKSSYGQGLNYRALGYIESGKSDDDLKKGLDLVKQALPYLIGTVNEASSYYIQSKLLYNLKDYSNALESINKALKIFDRKLYRDHKEKVEKQLSSK